jgi:hypothetical protein
MILAAGHLTTQISDEPVKPSEILPKKVTELCNAIATQF